MRLSCPWWLSAVFGCAGLALGVQSASEPESPPVAPRKAEASSNALARVGSEVLTLDAYRDFLLASRGLRDFEAFIDREVLRREARRQRLSIPYEEIDRATEARLERTIRMFGGDRAAAIESIERRGMTWDDYREAARSELIWEHLITRLYRERAAAEGQTSPASSPPPTSEEITPKERREFLDRLRDELGFEIGEPSKVLEGFRRRHGW